MNFKVIQESIDRYFLTGGEISGEYIVSSLDIDLSCSWVDCSCDTDNFSYYVSDSEFEVIRHNSSHYYILNKQFGSDTKECWDGYNEMGKYICKYLESQGWEYREGDF
jgi:hypothetical protein